MSATDQSPFNKAGNKSNLNLMKETLLFRLRNNQTLTLSFVMILALITRLIGINSRPLWYDEAFSVLFAEKGPAAMLVGTLSSTTAGAADIHPLTYYTVLWAWMRIFGESPVAIRTLSIIFSLIVVLISYLLTRKLFGHPTALAAALIIALSPFQVHYGQEIRMYSLMTLWLILATYCYWRGSRSLQWHWWVAFGVFAALAQYTHNLACFYLATLAIWPLIQRDWRVVKWIVMAGSLALLLYLPWLIHLPSQFARVEQGYWVERPELYRFFTLLLYFVTNLPLPGWHLAAGLLIALSIVAIAVIQTVNVARRHQPGAQRAYWLVYLSFSPPMLMFLFSQWKPVYVERALLPSGVMFCIWVAWAISSTHLQRPIQALMTLLLGAGFVLGLYDHVTYTGFPYAPYDALMQNIRANKETGEIVIHSSKLSMLPSVYYARDINQVYVADPPGSPEDTLAPSTQHVLGLVAKPDIRTAANGARRVRFVIFLQSNQEYVKAGYPAHPHLTWLTQHYALTEVQKWGDLRVYLFSKTSRDFP